MQVDVVEAAGFDGPDNHVGRAVGRKPDVADPSLIAKLFCDVEAPAGADRLFEQLVGVDAVEAEQIDVIEAEVAHRLVEGLAELGGIGRRNDLRLDDDLVPWQLRKDPAELHLGSSVAAGRFDVVDPQFEGPADGRLEIGLVGSRNVFRRHVLPVVLVTHPTTGQDRHGQLSAAKAAGRNSHAGRMNDEHRKMKDEASARERKGPQTQLPARKSGGIGRERWKTGCGWSFPMEGRKDPSRCSRCLVLP